MFRFFMTCLITVGFSVPLFAANSAASFEHARSAVAVMPTITSPQQINAVPHPIASNKPKRKIHKNPIPKPEWTRGVEIYDPTNPRHYLDRSGTAAQRDVAGYAPCKSFAGIGATGWDPPDPCLAAGPNHVIEVVNSSIAIFDKNTGVKLLQSTAGFWFGSTVPAPPSGFIYDPKVVFDPVAQRFVILYLCTDDVSKASFLVSVSQTADAMGSWYSYNFDATLNGATPANTWADYPGLGFDYDEAVYLTSNMWTFSGDYLYTKVRILPKAQLYSGGPVSYSDLWDLRYHDLSTAFTVKPAVTLSDADGEFLLSNIWYGGSYTTVWKVVDPLTSPSLNLLPRVNVPAYPPPPNAQQKGGNDIGLLGSMTQDVVYRNGTVYTAFDQSFNWGGGAVAAARVFGVDTATAAATTDITYGSDLKHYFFPHLYVDPDKRIFLGYNRSSAEEYIGVWCAEDLVPGTIGRLIKAGDGPRGGGTPVRWGDYSAVAGDPVDPNRVWVVNEYNAVSSSEWRTWIGQVPARVLAPVQAAPTDASRQRVPIALSWDLLDPATTYVVQVDKDTSFATPDIDVTVSSNSYSAAGLSGETVYHWRVRGVSACPDNPWSNVWSFTACTFIPGDADGNSITNISDAVSVVAYIFGGGAAPTPLISGDANCDTQVTIADAVYLINYVFAGGPAPCDPC
ncbi:MAG: hypothetical protein IT585_02305 [candidate division Zixibacteria bacterium]|nr:hypothetical protein [candidate division Zixibacteria bacterium]